MGVTRLCCLRSLFRDVRVVVREDVDGRSMAVRLIPCLGCVDPLQLR